MIQTPPKEIKYLSTILQTTDQLKGHPIILLHYSKINPRTLTSGDFHPRVLEMVEFKNNFPAPLFILDFSFTFFTNCRAFLESLDYDGKGGNKSIFHIGAG